MLEILTDKQIYLMQAANSMYILLCSRSYGFVPSSYMV